MFWLIATPIWIAMGLLLWRLASDKQITDEQPRIETAWDDE
jgi:hypothetical protein